MMNKYVNTKRQTWSACHGCGLCALVCPLWQTWHQIELTPWGRAKMIQAGADAKALANSINQCLLCAACEPICPQQIDIVGLTLALRQQNVSHADVSKVLAQDAPIITEDGLLYRYLKLNYPKKTCYGIGEWLMKQKLLSQQLTHQDLYMINAPLLHANYQTLIKQYWQLQQTTGCQMNLNLNRTAMALGTESEQQQVIQQQWKTLSQRPFQRIVVENRNDQQWLLNQTTVPVVHAMELCHEQT